MAYKSWYAIKTKQANNNQIVYSTSGFEVSMSVVTRFIVA